MFHPLRVTAHERLTDDAVAITLAVPEERRADYGFLPGQHIALRHFDQFGAELRRTYSLCDRASGAPSTLRIGVRRIEGGEFSSYALKELSVGDSVEALPPVGRFTLRPRPGHFAAVVGGSGITPVLSIASSLLSEVPEARFTLVRSDRSAASTMFLDEVAELKDRYPARFQLAMVFSREEQQTGLSTGRLDTDRLGALLPGLLPTSSVDGWYLCGPFGLVRETRRALRGFGVSPSLIHQEIFHAEEFTAADVSLSRTDGAEGAGPPSTAGFEPGGSESPAASAADAAAAEVRVTLDGRSGGWPMRSGETVLETVLRHRADAPYACKGGVCGTCRARLVSGEVRMDRNYALESDELAAGYVLACQSRPQTDSLEVDFDA